MVDMQSATAEISEEKTKELECGSLANLMAALTDIGGALCSTPQILGWRPLPECRAVTLPRRETR